MNMENKGGRPSMYSRELAEKICDLVATNPEGLKHLCNQNNWMPCVDTIREWRWKNEEFSALYTKAKLSQAELLTEDCLDIADNTDFDTLTKEKQDGEEYEVANTEWINRSRLRVDTRKWLASKLLPRVYGDAKIVEDLQVQNSVLKEELIELRASLDAKNKKEY